MKKGFSLISFFILILLIAIFVLLMLYLNEPPKISEDYSPPKFMVSDVDSVAAGCQGSTNSVLTFNGGSTNIKSECLRGLK
jgi:hypothetical protein